MRRTVSRTIRAALGQPSVAAVAILSLALGIGANSAIFSFVDAVLLRPLPVEEPDRLVWIHQGDQDRARGSFAYLNFRDLADRLEAFNGVAAFSRRGAVLSGEGSARLVTVDVVSPDYFAVVGIEAGTGRLFTREEADPSAPPIVVIGHALWQRRFGGDPSIIGRTIHLNTLDVTVVGVTPAEFRGLERHVDPELWVPMSTWRQLAPGNRSEFDRRDLTWLTVFGRLGEGVERRTAAEEVETLGEGLAERYPEANAGIRLTVEPLDTGDEDLASIGMLLLTIAGLVLVVSCANVANLLLVRSETRRTEVALRAALGAGRGRLFRQMLVEALVLGAAGATAGLLLASWVIRLLPALLPPTTVTPGFDFRLDARVIAFTVVVAGGSVLLFGLVPAMRGSRLALMSTLRGGRGTAEIGSRFGLRRGVVVAQMALCVVLLTAAGLLLRNLWSVEGVEMGFERGELLLVRVLPTIMGSTQPQAEELYRELEERVDGLPGVRATAWTRRVPLAGSGGGARREIVVPGIEPPPGRGSHEVRYTAVGVGYFEAMGTRLLEGRTFRPADDPMAPSVAVINATMAGTYWPAGDAIGSRFLLGGPDGVECTVVGIVETGKYLSLTEEPRPYLFLPLAQAPSSDMTFLVATDGPATGIADAVEAELRAIDPRIPILTMETLESHLALPLYEHRLGAGLLTALGVIALMLAVVGLYGVIAYSVRRRVREIGIRIALGAARRDILRFVMGDSGSLLSVGIVIGLAGAAVTGRMMASMLYGMSPFDPAVIASVIVILAAAAATASLLPALRATRIDPRQALRND